MICALTMRSVRRRSGPIPLDMPSKLPLPQWIPPQLTKLMGATPRQGEYREMAALESDQLQKVKQIQRGFVTCVDPERYGLPIDTALWVR
jgi:hypothetical protein